MILPAGDQVLIEAATEDGSVISLQLQNAETVKLVGPKAIHSGKGRIIEPLGGRRVDRRDQGGQPLVFNDWRAISVADLKEGDELLTYIQEGARHTGIAIQEFIVER